MLHPHRLPLQDSPAPVFLMTAQPTAIAGKQPTLIAWQEFHGHVLRICSHELFFPFACRCQETSRVQRATFTPTLVNASYSTTDKATQFKACIPFYILTGSQAC